MDIIPLAQTDAYKISHKGFMGDDTEFIDANMTPRSANYLPVLKEFYDNKVIFFSLQFFILDYLIDEWNRLFFNKPKEQVIEEFKFVIDNYLGEDAVSMEHFEKLHDLGYLPISIKALPEGSLVPLRVPFFTIINTHPDFAWLTNYLETVISCETWKPCTTATIAREYRKLINRFALETTGSILGTEYQGHGFEFRGMSGRHDAAISGCGHLLSFVGTDTIPSIFLLKNYYNADLAKEQVAASVPASEHMVTSLGIATITEREFYRRSITKSYPTGIVSLVADTQDFFKVITEDALALREDILARKPNKFGLAKVVFRPDSGNPVKIVCGYSPDEYWVRADGSYQSKETGKDLSLPEIKGAIECLWDIFGGTESEQGYKILHERVGLIYGDSITLPIANDILTGLKNKGFASTNVVLGIGSFTYNCLTRDCIGAAIKGTWAQVNGKGIELFKDPKTDSGIKKSAKGLLRVDLVNGEYVLKDQCTKEEEAGGELKEVFRDGKLLINQTLAEIRARVAASI